MRSIIVGIGIMLSLMVSSIATADTFDLDPAVTRATLNKGQIEQVALNIEKQSASVSVGLGHMDQGQFTIKENRLFLFTGQDYTDLLTTLNSGQAALDTFIKALVDASN